MEERLLLMPVVGAGAGRVGHFMRELIDSGGAFPLEGGRIMDGNGEWIDERERWECRDSRGSLRSGWVDSSMS